MAPIDIEAVYTDLAARSARDSITPTDTQRATLIVAAIYIVLIGILARADPGRDHLPIQASSYKQTVGMHEMSHAIAGVLTCARIEHIHLDPNEGGSTTMRGGIPLITLPAGYLGSSFIGAGLIACGFDIVASRVACLVLIFFSLITLFWARRSWVAFATFGFMFALIAVCWLVYHSVALRFLVLFIGVMSCMYCIWDIVDDTLKRKVASSDASEFAKQIGFGSSRMWGAFWLVMSCGFFVAGILIGIVAFKTSWQEQIARADKFMGGTP